MPKCAHSMKISDRETIRCADCGKTVGKEPKQSLKFSRRDQDTLKLCIAGAWLYGTISGGMAREIAKIFGMTAEEIEDLKFIEATQKEKEREAGDE